MGYAAAGLMGAVAAFSFMASKERYYKYKAELWESRSDSMEKAMAHWKNVADARLISIRHLEKSLDELNETPKADERLGGPVAHD